jgi:hypothetical protein
MYTQFSDAECHTAAWSGYGMVKNCCGGETLASDIWYRTLGTIGSANTSDPHGTVKYNQWNFSSWVPDVVVINLGTNDNLGQRQELIPLYNQTYLDLVVNAAHVYNMHKREQQNANYGVQFLLACGPMSDAYCSQVEWVIEQCQQQNIQASFLDFRGFLNGTFGEACCGHPGSGVDRAMAQYATQVITQTLLKQRP